MPDGALRYSTDSERGIVRRPSGEGFRYIGTGGRPIRDAATLARVAALDIPPSWREVWICRDGLGHLQAVGRDARGRKQPRYHVAWRRQRDELEFGRVAAFGRALPRIRRRVERDVSGMGSSNDKVLATVVRLLATSVLRIGDAAVAWAGTSFVRTTLRDGDVTTNGAGLLVRFPGKGAKVAAADVRHGRLARIVARCGSLPGQELFQYPDESGVLRSIGSSDVNAYLRDAAGSEVTARDFRTWVGTLAAFHELMDRPGNLPASSGRSEELALVRFLERAGSMAKAGGGKPAD